MAEKIELKIHLARDEESGRWYVAESDIPGLHLEGATATELMQRIELAAPEMIELNVEEIVAKHARKIAAPVMRAAPERPAVSYLPIFDTPLAAAYA